MGDTAGRQCLSMAAFAGVCGAPAAAGGAVRGVPARCRRRWATQSALQPAGSKDEVLLDAQEATPLLSALSAASKDADAMFCCPGHKRGRATPSPMADALALQQGTPPSVFQLDLPELPSLDNLFAPEAVLAEAQDLAADVFAGGRDRFKTFFLVNGSTSGVIASITAATASLRLPPGRTSTVILPRNAHQSAIHALVVAGSSPLFISPVYDAERDLIHPVQPDEVRDALVRAAEENMSVAAVFIVSPTYHGVVANVEEIAGECVRAGVPLIIDEAHGAHLSCDQTSPVSSVQYGADVVIQSTHKTLGALTQASMLHWKRETSIPQKIMEQQLMRALQLVQSTSPSNLLLASLDAARWQVARFGAAMMQTSLRLAALARERISTVRGLDVLTRSSVPSSFDWDPTRLVVLILPDILCRGVTGFDLDDSLIDKFGVYCELPALKHLTFIVTAGNDEEDINKLVNALEKVSDQTFAADTAQTSDRYSDQVEIPSLGLSSITEIGASPRAAFFGPTLAVSLDDPQNPAVGATCACVVCPYPPGIPVLLPGEIVTYASLEYLRAVERAGGTITGLDEDRCFDVVSERDS